MWKTDIAVVHESVGVGPVVRLDQVSVPAVWAPPFTSLVFCIINRLDSVPFHSIFCLIINTTMWDYTVCLKKKDV